jgi:antirestriction protein ArdC
MRDIHKQVTESILEQLEKGVRPWAKSWNAADISRPLRSCGTPYQGINVLQLWARAHKDGFSSATWLTFNQSKALGGSVRKGSKGTMVVYANAFVKDVETPDGIVQETRPYLRAYTVFNVDLIDGLPDKFYEKRTPVAESDRNAAAEAFLKSTGATVYHGGAKAYYSLGVDAVTLPDPGAFDSMEAYYSTAAHELIHWTAKRLGRKLAAFGTPDYAFEELIAEIGAAYLCADLGITAEPREDHACYLASWLKRLGDDNRAIFRASTAAQAAVAYLQELGETASEPQALELEAVAA